MAKDIDKYWDRFEDISNKYDSLNNKEIATSRKDIEANGGILHGFLTTFTKLQNKLSSVLSDEKLNRQEKEDAQKLLKSISAYINSTSHKLQLNERNLNLTISNSSRKRERRFFFLGIVGGLLCSFGASFLYDLMFQQEDNEKIQHEITLIKNDVIGVKDSLKNSLLPIESSIYEIGKTLHKVDSVVSNIKIKRHAVND